MTTEAVVTKCAVVECVEPGDWRPVFIIPPPRGTHPTPDLVAIRAGLSLVVCGRHAATTKLNDLLSDQLWDRITETCQMLGRVVPLREDVTLGLFHRADPKFDETNPERMKEA